ncbi:hypothetical protein AMJ86_03090 [bacterium SM23_57]|nr:MAG: hypothetical protein AMJ86_03090 [bacterium SM23_57]
MIALRTAPTGSTLDRKFMEVPGLIEPSTRRWILPNKGGPDVLREAAVITNPQRGKKRLP